MGDMLRPGLVIAGAIALGGGAAILVFGGGLMDARQPPPQRDERPVREPVGQVDAAAEADRSRSAEGPPQGAGEPSTANAGDEPDRAAPPGVELAQVGAPGPWRAGARDAGGARLPRLGDRDRAPDTAAAPQAAGARAPVGTVRDGVDQAFQAMGVPQPPSHAQMQGLDQPIGQAPDAPPPRGADTAAPPLRSAQAADSG